MPGTPGTEDLEDVDVLRHRVAAAAAFAVVAVECAGGTPPTDVTPVALEAPAPDLTPSESPVPAADVGAAAQRVAPPPASAPEPQPLAAPAPLPDEVDVVRPDLRIDGVSPSAAATVHAVDGVEDAVQVGSLEVSAPGEDGPRRLTALAVDVDLFRPFTPDVTANEVGVWQRLQEGNAVLTAAVANHVGADLGGRVTLSGSRSSEDVRVGALAANGLPQLADLLLPEEAARRLATDVQETLLVAVADGVDVATVAHRLQEAVGGEVTVLEEPVQEQVQPEPVGRATLESFTYQSVGDGTIRIDPAWVGRNIVTTTVPVLGRVTCHRLLIPQLSAALQEVEAAGLAGEIYMYSGCWVPRHMMWNPNRSVSLHAWGLAFDINVPTNGYGATPQLDMRIVDIFRKWGFKWGGDFSPPDGMHFELARLVTP